MKVIPKLEAFLMRVQYTPQSPVRDNQCQVVNIFVRGTLVFTSLHQFPLTCPPPPFIFTHAHLDGAYSTVISIFYSLFSIMSPPYFSLPCLAPFYFSLSPPLLLKFLLLKINEDQTKKKKVGKNSAWEVAGKSRSGQGRRIYPAECKNPLNVVVQLIHGNKSKKMKTRRTTTSTTTKTEKQNL